MCVFQFIFFLVLGRPPCSTLFPTRRSSDLFGAEQCREGNDWDEAPSRRGRGGRGGAHRDECAQRPESGRRQAGDRKSTRLNSSHLVISYAVFCLKKKK